MQKNKLFNILDCTVRDGGYINNWDFPIEIVKKMYQTSSKCGIDIFEIGFLSDDENLPLWRRSPRNAILEVKASYIDGAKISVMLEAKTTDIEIGTPNESGIDILRVALNKNAIEASIPKMKKYKDKGYFIFIQLMGITSYNDQEIIDYTRMIDDSGYFDVIGIGDSYGSLIPDRTKEIVTLMKKHSSLMVDLHAHNNMHMGMANCLSAVDAGADYIDASMLGLGRGGGNVPLELLTAYYAKIYRNQFSVMPILELIDLYLYPITKGLEWGYSLPSVISGIYECHPYYTSKMIARREYTISQILIAAKCISEMNITGFSEQVLTDVVNTHEVIRKRDHKKLIQKFVNEYKDDVTYINRHKDRLFLILGNGPSLINETDRIKTFINKHNPIIIGANNLPEYLSQVDYHAFSNQRRFEQYIDTVSPKSKLLLSQWIDKDGLEGDYEDVIYYNSSMTDLGIKDGIITSNCRSVSILLAVVALVMGAESIYFAGLDGYLEGNALFYAEDEHKDGDYLIEKQNGNQKYINSLLEYTRRHGNKKVSSLTSTTYDFDEKN